MAALAVDSTETSHSFAEREFAGDTMPVITERKLDGGVLSTRIIKELENFYSKADAHDKAKCIDLITSVRLDQDLKKHLKKIHHSKPAGACGYTTVLNPYQTSYDKDYPPKTGRHIWAIRPMTSVGYVTSVPDSKTQGPTEYDAEYFEKFQRPVSPERAATSSGQRNNKPHPPQSFLVWKFPSKNRNIQDGGVKLSADLTNEKLNQITKRLCHSVYQNDYLGIPQGFQVASAFNLPSNWKENVPHVMDSSQRRAYQQPHQLRELTVPITRYGSNTLKQIPAVTVIPTANKRLTDVDVKTTYDRHFNSNAGPVIEEIINAGKKREAETLRARMKSNGHDNGQIDKLLMEFEEPNGVMIHSHERVACPSPPRSSRSSSAPPTAQRKQFASPGEIGYKINQHASASRTARAVFSDNKPHLSVYPGATTISPYLGQMPASPLSVPYTPPMFLS